MDVSHSLPNLNLSRWQGEPAKDVQYEGIFRNNAGDVRFKERIKQQVGRYRGKSVEVKKVILCDGEQH
jgi:hypothetical protein